VKERTGKLSFIHRSFNFDDVASSVSVVNDRKRSKFTSEKRMTKRNPGGDASLDCAAWDDDRYAVWR
jgi:hypothetical protein